MLGNQAIPIRRTVTVLHIEIVSLNFEYTYASGRSSTLNFAGDIMLGELQLTLLYDYHPQEATKWDFTASLSIEQSATNTTVNGIIESICESDVSLPTPIRNTSIPLDSTLSLAMFKTTQTTTANGTAISTVDMTCIWRSTEGRSENGASCFCDGPEKQY
jgi:hypothetical protein